MKIMLWEWSWFILGHKQSYHLDICIINNKYNKLLCPWFFIRKAIWYVSNCQILHNIYLFSSSCLCPVGCLSFVLWKKNRNRLHEYSKICQFDTYQKAFLMRNQGHINPSQLQNNQTLPPPVPMVHSALLILGNF